MALSNYSDLLAAINGSAAWLHRTDLAAIAPDWVTLLEATLNNGCEIAGEFVDGLRTADQETVWTSASTTPAVTVSGVQTVALPADFLEMRQLFITYNGIRRELLKRPITPFSYSREIALNNVPKYYWQVGSSLYLDPIPSGAYPLTGTYYAKIGPLATQATNWLMTASPMVYLHGSIAHGAPWMGANFNPAPWVAGFKAALSGVRASDARKRIGGIRQAPSDASQLNGRRFDPMTGTG